MHTSGRKIWWRSLISAGLLGLVAVAVYRNRTQFAESLQIVRDASPIIVLGMAVLFFVTAGCAALTYYFLSFRKIPYRNFYLVEFAAAGVNRLLPAGVGNVGLHGVFLHRQRHTLAETVAVLSVNNALGVTTHLVLLLALLLLNPSVFQSLDLGVPAWLPGAVIAIVLLASALLSVPTLRSRLRSFMHNFWVSLRRYRKHVGKLIGAGLSSLGITTVNVLIFTLAAKAVGIDVGMTQLFFIYTTGVVFGSVTPTPGGLGGVEAGLVAGMLAIHVAAPEALAAALTFRLVTYWLPVMLGMAAFIAARARRLI